MSKVESRMGAFLVEYPGYAAMIFECCVAVGLIAVRYRFSRVLDFVGRYLIWVWIVAAIFAGHTLVASVALSQFVDLVLLLVPFVVCFTSHALLQLQRCDSRGLPLCVRTRASRRAAVYLLNYMLCWGCLTVYTVLLRCGVPARDLVGLNVWARCAVAASGLLHAMWFGVQRFWLRKEAAVAARSVAFRAAGAAESVAKTVVKLDSEGLARSPGRRADDEASDAVLISALSHGSSSEGSMLFSAASDAGLESAAPHRSAVSASTCPFLHSRAFSVVLVSLAILALVAIVLLGSGM